MKRPSFLAYLLGNPISFLVLVGNGGYFIYEWWIGRMGDVAPVLGVFIIGTAFGCMREVEDYSAWKMTWDAMGGVSPGMKWRWLNWPISLGIWGLIGFGISRLDPHLPITTIAITCYGIATLVLGFKVLRRLWRRIRPRRQRPRKEVPVAIALKLPKRSPGPKEFYKGIPAYCARLVWKR